MTRLDKLLSDAGYSRSEAKEMIKYGRVRVNGETAKRPETKVGEADEVFVDGAAIGDRSVYLMMNKPDGVVTATEDRQQKTVLDLLGKEYAGRGVFPAGRLDKDTTGLLILTNDGAFGHELTSPRHHVAKVYELRCGGALAPEDVSTLAAGAELSDGTKCLPAKLAVDPEDPEHATLEITEGKYHQVKRMLASLGKPVTSLKRLSVGGLSLDEKLAPGEYRAISEQERNLIFGEK